MFEKVITDSLISPKLEAKMHSYARVQRRLMRRRLLLVFLSFLFFLTQSAGLLSASVPAGAQGSIETSGRKQLTTPLVVENITPASSAIENDLHFSFQPVLAVVAAILFCLNLVLYFRNYLLYKELRIILRKQDGT